MIGFRYQERDSPIHRLSPFCKMVWVGAITLVSLFFQHPLYLAVFFLATVPAVLAARIWRPWAVAMLLGGFVGANLVFINAVLIHQGSTVLVEATYEIPTLGTPRITLEAIFYGLMMTLRILIVVSAFTVFNFTIHPDDQLRAFIQLKLPHKSVLVTSMGTRFAPLLFEDLVRLGDAQRARGLEIDRGNLFRRIRKRSSLIIPLLANALDRTVQMAEAMESRAFGQGNNRTFFKRLKVTPFDWLTIGIAAVPIVWGIVIAFGLDYGSFRYYETLDPLVPRDGVESALLIGLFLFSFALVPLGVLKRRVDLD